MVKSNSNTKLITKGRLLYFDEEHHKYTDDLGNLYTSTTTVIDKYHYKKDFKKIAAACEKIGRNPYHKNYFKYRNKTAKQILAEWEEDTKRACDKGNEKHNFLESAIKKSTGYSINSNGFINSRIYTVDNIIEKHKYGKLDLSYFRSTGIDVKYPEIYSTIEFFVKLGYKIYAEIGVYDYRNLISGLIDLLLVKGSEFIILDWKTNKAPLRFESGYYEKDKDGFIDENRFKLMSEKLIYPLSHLDDSVGNKYTLQLSTYAKLVETWGFKCKGILLCHIRTLEKEFDSNRVNKEVVQIYPINYLKREVQDMIADHTSKHTTIITQKLFIK